MVIKIMPKYVDKSNHGKQNLFKKNYLDAGYDICSNEDILVPRYGSALISTGLYMEIPEGFVGILKSRSGLSVKNNLEIGAGVIDSLYRGEVKVHLYNFGEYSFEVRKGDRIAQLIILQVALGNWEKVETLSETDRGSNGFGSSGVS